MIYTNKYFKKYNYVNATIQCRLLKSQCVNGVGKRESAQVTNTTHIQIQQLKIRHGPHLYVSPYQ